MSLARKFLAPSAAVGCLIAAVTLPSASAEAGSPPFVDRASTGSITLCDRSGHQATSGSVLSVPFIWSAVSSVAAPSRYAKGAATLYAYQAQQGVDPSYWNGYQLTGSSSFTNPANPVAQATNADNPLIFFEQQFPLRFNGYLELRIYLSARNQPVYNQTYPTAILQVKGNTWTVVSGGNTACSVGNGTSTENGVLPASELATAPSIVLGTLPKQGSTTTTPAGTSGGSATGTTVAGATSPSVTAASGGSGKPQASGGTGQLAASHHSSGSGGLVAAAAVAVVAAAVAVTLLLRRRRRTL